MSFADELRSRVARQGKARAASSGATVGPDEFGEGQPAPALAADRSRFEKVPERSYASVAWVLAAGAVSIALILNWIAAPVVVGGNLTAGNGAQGGLGGSATAILNLPTQPSKMLPNDITAYEAIDSHPVPGQEKTAAEAIYQTYNMNVMAAVALTVYAHVQGYDSSADADKALDELMKKFPLKQAPYMVGPQPARTGYTSDEGAYVVAWAKGPYVTYVKTFFLDHIPAQKRNFLQANGDPVVRAVEVFERTGKQGAAGNVEAYKYVPKPRSGSKKSTQTTVGPSGFGGELLGPP